MHAAVEIVIAEMRADPVLRDHADACASALGAIDLEGDGSTDAIALMDAVQWIANQPCTIDEKLKALHKLFAQTGRVHIDNMREFCGW
jgi:predicted ATPase with chaperone activity